MVGWSVSVALTVTLRFYDPARIAALKAHAHTALDVAVYTLAAEAGPRLSEIRGLKVRNVDFASGLLRFEDGYTTTADTPATRDVASAPYR